jgi:arogenate dehydrogenase (NADP+)
LASSGFRDTSRVGGGNPELGVMVAKYNREELLRSLSIYRDSLDEFIRDIEAENWQALEHKLKLTQQARKNYKL